MTKAKVTVVKPARKRRALRLTCERMVSLTPEIDAGVQRACTYLGSTGSQYMREATLMRLINDRIVLPPSPPVPVETTA
jgi:hypothetical protein